jgi:hypothetical protein
MKKNLKILLAAALLAGAAAFPLRAQTDAAAETDTNQATSQAASTVTAPPARAKENTASVSQTSQAVSAATAPPEPNRELVRNIGQIHPTPMESFLSGIKGILVPLYPFVMAVAIIIIVFYFKHRRNQMMNETLRAMIDKGTPITPELLNSLKGNKNGVGVFGNFVRQRNDLRTGVILMGIGLGILFFAGKPGWIVFFIGLAYLIVSRIERNKPVNPPAQPPQMPQPPAPQPPTQ